MARELDNVAEMVIRGLFPRCLTPELYAGKPDYVDSLAAFVRGRPAQPLDALLRQSEAVIKHDAEPALARVRAPTQIRFGGDDLITSIRFSGAMKNGFRGSEMTVFENCAHAPIHEDVAQFNETALTFRKHHSMPPYWGWGSGPHARDIQEHVGLKLLFVQPLLHEIPDADDAGELPAVDHRDVADSAQGHSCQHSIHAIR